MSYFQDTSSASHDCLSSTGAVLPVLKQLYYVVEHSGYGRKQDGRKQNPKVFRAKLDGGDVIVGMPWKLLEWFCFFHSAMA